MRTRWTTKILWRCAALMKPPTTAAFASATSPKPRACRRRRSVARWPFRSGCARRRASACSPKCGASATRPTKPRARCSAGASRMILVVIPQRYSGAFFAGIINGIDDELSAEGYTMIVGSLDGIEDKARRLVDLVYARQIDGVIFFTGHIPLIDGRSLRDAGVPMVSICCEMDAANLPTVIVDDEACAIAQTRHLIDLGHRHLLYVSGAGGPLQRDHAIPRLSRSGEGFGRRSPTLRRRLHFGKRRGGGASLFRPRPAPDGRGVRQRRNGDRLHQDGDGCRARRSAARCPWSVSTASNSPTIASRP